MKKSVKLSLIIGILIFGFIVLMKNIPMPERYFLANYSFVEPKENVTGNLKLSAPVFSFAFSEEGTNNGINLTFINLRSNWAVSKEIEKHLASYDVVECNNTKYYYNSKDGYTILNYDIKNFFVYNIISYEFTFGNYCNIIFS